MNQQFSKLNRLLHPVDFKNVFDGAELKVSNNHFLFLARRNKYDVPRLGIVVSKKNIKLAVQRNKVKRAIRQAFRIESQSLMNIDIVVLARKDAGKMNSDELKISFDSLVADLKDKA